MTKNASGYADAVEAKLSTAPQRLEGVLEICREQWTECCCSEHEARWSMDELQYSPDKEAVWRAESMYSKNVG